MATKPTPGGSDGIYGTELNAFLDVSIADDGKIKDGAVLEAATETADGDRTVVDLGYVKTGDTVAHDSEGAFQNADVNGTKTKVYTKYFTGTLDSDSSTDVAHGVASGATKILACVAATFVTGQGNYIVRDMQIAHSALTILRVSFGDTNVNFGSVGTQHQGQGYKLKIDYIL